MISYTSSLFSRICIASGRRTVITAALKEIPNEDVASLRTTESYPPKHDAHLNKIYTVPEDVLKLLENNMSIEFKKRLEIFREFGILIRKPAIELITYLEQTDYTKPINRYVLHGRNGTGKSTTLMHLIHYGLAKHFIVVHVPWVPTWFTFPMDAIESSLIPGKMDLPTHGVKWLKYFSHLNPSLSQRDLKVSKEYVWSDREITKPGDSLSSLIEFGLQRTRFVCGVISALINELKAASTAGKCRTLIVIDGFNAFLSKCTLVRDATLKYLPPESISITEPFYNSVNCNWSNGAAILTVDVKATKEMRQSDNIQYLLGKNGFEHLDPFLPIHVDNYTADEFETIIKYYEDRKWLRNVSFEGRVELKMLTNKNPFEIWQYSKPL